MTTSQWEWACVWLWLFWLLQQQRAGLRLPFNSVKDHFQTHVDTFRNVPLFRLQRVLLLLDESSVSILKGRNKKERLRFPLLSICSCIASSRGIVKWCSLFRVRTEHVKILQMGSHDKRVITIKCNRRLGLCFPNPSYSTKGQFRIWIWEYGLFSVVEKPGLVRNVRPPNERH